MRTIYFLFPRMNLSLTAGEEVLEKTFVFFPFNTEEKKPPSLAHAYRVKREGKKWVVSKDGNVLDRRGSDWEAVFVLEYDIETSVLEHRRDWLAIHAGAVADEGEACLVAGNPDSGKTTVTFHLVEMGWRFMCEEITFVDTQTREVHPYLQTLSLESRFIDAVKADLPITGGKIQAVNPSLVRYSPNMIQRKPMKLGTICVPKRDPEAKAEVIPLSPGAFLTEFMGYCFEPKAGMEDLLDRAIRLLEECRIYRVVYSDVDDCRKILLGLFPAASI